MWQLTHLCLYSATIARSHLVNDRYHFDNLADRYPFDNLAVRYPFGVNKLVKQISLELYSCKLIQYCQYSFKSYQFRVSYYQQLVSSKCMGKTFQAATTNTLELFDHRSLLQNIFLISAKLNFHRTLVCSTARDIQYYTKHQGFHKIGETLHFILQLV